MGAAPPNPRRGSGSASGLTLPAAAGLPRTRPASPKAAPVEGSFPRPWVHRPALKSPQQAAKESAAAGVAACRRAQASPAGPVLGPAGGADKARPRRAARKKPPGLRASHASPVRHSAPRPRPPPYRAPSKKQKQKHEPSSPNQHVERGSPQSKGKSKSQSRAQRSACGKGKPEKQKQRQKQKPAWGLPPQTPQPEPRSVRQKKGARDRAAAGKEKALARRYAPSNPAAVSCITLNGLP